MTTQSIGSSLYNTATSGIEWVTKSGKELAASTSAVACDVWAAVSSFFTKIAADLGAFLSASKDYLGTQLTSAREYLGNLPREAWGGAVVGAALTALGAVTFKYCCASPAPLPPAPPHREEADRVPPETDAV
jgi:hypothetical protein